MFDHNVLVILKWILKEYNAKLKNKSGKGTGCGSSWKIWLLENRSS
jgi:hypothetical protein